MDITAEKQRLDNEKRAIQAYLDHPISRKIFEDNKEQEEQAIEYICNIPIDSIEAFFKHFEAVGHLRGLRRAMSLIKDDVEEIETQLSELPNE
jgi:hypothetical protein